MTRYREVKTRVSHWHGVARLSLVGRNILLQSILYGSVRYWFFTLPVPEKIIELIESDAKALLWARHPELHTDEEGTAKRSNRQIRKEPSYLPTRQGGGGIMHLKSHITAFQAQWPLRYIDPRSTPWKDCLDHWIGDKFALGRGILLARPKHNFASRLPESLVHLRACFKAFQKLDVRMDTSHITFASQGETLWFNQRFSLPIPSHAKTRWTHDMNTYRLSDLADEDDQPFTHAHFAHWIAHTMGSNHTQQWVSSRLSEVPLLMRNVPPQILQATTTRPPQAAGDYVAVKAGLAPAEVGVVSQAGTIQEIFLDASGFPHLTGQQINPGPNDKITPVATWRYLNPHFTEPLAGQNEDGAPQQRVLTSIIGPVTGAFPLNEGWYLAGQTPRKPQHDEHLGDDLRRLTDNSIHEITVHLTEQITKGHRPSCEVNWQACTHCLPPNPSIPWTQIWASIGTELSDPTEEASWRKLIHRAWSSRNRFPKEPNKSCRLGCGCNDESQLHMIECQRAQPLWRAALNFCTTVLGEPFPISTTHAVIFWMHSPQRLIGEASRAFLRHTVGAYYRDVTRVHENKVAFVWERTFHHALRAFRDAVLRRGYAIRLQYVHRINTSLTEQVPEETRKKFGILASITETGTTTLTPVFDNAIASAETAADANARAQQAGGRPRARHRGPRR